MDVQGSSFHLLHGAADWAVCVDERPDLPLAEVGAIWPTPELTRPDSDWEFNHDRDWLRLRRDTPRFHQVLRTAPYVPEARRGAGRDKFGAWYWIDADRRTIRSRAVGDPAAHTWWSIEDLHVHCSHGGSGADFTAAANCPPDPAELVGLAVTTGHYLVVGYAGPAGSGLLLFDLHAGGGPERLGFGAAEFTPWDLVDLPDGGLLVLDREHGRYWQLDARFRVPGEETYRPGTFADLTGDGPTPRRYRSGPRTPGRLLEADGRRLHPISIEPGADGTVLVLESDATLGHSVVYCFRGEALVWTLSLQDVVEVIDLDDPNQASRRFSPFAHDFAYQPADATRPLAGSTLYIADAQGDQVIALELDAVTGSVIARDDFLPLRRWGARALHRAGGTLWYDFGERWIEVGVLTENRFASTATLQTPLPAGDLPGEPFDSQLPGCVWHRLLLDALAPSGTSISIEARAADDVTVLPAQPWLPQPVPLRRGDGSELPWADPWRDQRSATGRLPEGMGTLELLFQQVVGRYLQVRVTLTGGGGASAAIRSLRAWYPRFSYVQHYLPAVYAEHDRAETFLERFLANPEGIFTALEEKIEHSHLLLDARTAREADLAWLGSWFALALDPAWPVDRRRFLISNVDAFYRRRGTVAGLIGMLRVLFDPEVTEQTVFARTPVPATCTRIRLVERFLTRGPGLDGVRRAAHRFLLQVPGSFTADQADLAERIVEQGKPAHTEFTLESYDSLFTIGGARLGLDTELGPSWRFAPVRIGTTRLGTGYLSANWPFDITDRLVSDRDRLPQGPPL